MAAGCSSRRPVLYPNEQYQRAGDAAAQEAINECIARAEQFAHAESQAGAKAKDAAKQTAYGGATGAAIGAVGGAISGGAGHGAAVGAATGATAGLLHSLFGGFFGPSGPDPIVAAYADRCLRDKSRWGGVEPERRSAGCPRGRLASGALRRGSDRRWLIDRIRHSGLPLTGRALGTLPAGAAARVPTQRTRPGGVLALQG
jgi:hypothetical protein